MPTEKINAQALHKMMKLANGTKQPLLAYTQGVLIEPCVKSQGATLVQTDGICLCVWHDAAAQLTKPLFLRKSEQLKNYISKGARSADSVLQIDRETKTLSFETTNKKKNIPTTLHSDDLIDDTGLFPKWKIFIKDLLQTPGRNDLPTAYYNKQRYERLAHITGEATELVTVFPENTGAQCLIGVGTEAPAFMLLMPLLMEGPPNKTISTDSFALSSPKRWNIVKQKITALCSLG